VLSPTLSYAPIGIGRGCVFGQLPWEVSTRTTLLSKVLSVERKAGVARGWRFRPGPPTAGSIAGSSRSTMLPIGGTISETTVKMDDSRMLPFPGDLSPSPLSAWDGWSSVPLLPCQPPNRRWKVQMIVFHQKADNRPACTAPETIVSLPLRTYVERGCLLLVERTDREKARPHPLEWETANDDGDYVRVAQRCGGVVRPRMNPHPVKNGGNRSSLASPTRSSISTSTCTG